MTQTQTPQFPDLLITAVAHRGWSKPNGDFSSSWCEYFFNGEQVGFTTDASMRLVDEWGMEFDVACRIVRELWDDAFTEDGNDIAETLLTSAA